MRLCFLDIMLGAGRGPDEGGILGAGTQDAHNHHLTQVKMEMATL